MWWAELPAAANNLVIQVGWKGSQLHITVHKNKLQLPRSAEIWNTHTHNKIASFGTPATAAHAQSYAPTKWQEDELVCSHGQLVEAAEPAQLTGDLSQQVVVHSQGLQRSTVVQLMWKRPQLVHRHIQSLQFLQVSDLCKFKRWYSCLLRPIPVHF